MSGFVAKIKEMLVGENARLGVPIPKATKNSVAPKMTDRELLKLESKLGSMLFGKVPEGNRREFFCLDESTWIWHEEWRDEKGVNRQSTTRYEVRPNGILKVTEGPRYLFIEGEELDNFDKATRLYYERTSREIYKRDPKTGLKFA